MSSGFVTESEAAEARKRRQEEWEKVRTPDQPLERPEEPYDGRSLFERLKEQKMKKDLEYEEAHKLKNLIRGLDDDEVQFLELVDQNKIDAEKKQIQEERKELQDFRDRVATLQEETADKKLQSEIKTGKLTKISTAATSARPTQKSLLGLGIKRKNGEIAGSSNAISAKVVKDCPTTDAIKLNALTSINTDQFNKGQLKCVAILPGIGPYTESSDSEISSGSEDEPDNYNNGNYDLMGRKKQKKKGCQDDD
ncbi:PSME3-interacting protein [Zeugodacus cucurbitae]|uniref:Protein FAM192A n=1 Tax=Zeugodacus cucurbitae TaxID=28588 RepID=A0A0A1X1F7_ZEUCU|nr:PSME3-interacting protein [Zeugodacus cucurbitae]